MSMNIANRLLLFTAVAIISCSGSSADCDNCNIKEEVREKATQVKTIVVDVRTADEWNNDGHAACAVNYPLDELAGKTDTLKTFGKIEVVCRSGHRAAMAKEMLEKAGIRNVENKGSWENISCK